jgi:NAD+ kinase
MTSAPSVGIVYKRRHERARIEAASLGSWLQERGVETFSEEMGVEESIYGCSEGPSTIPAHVSWVVVLGGDGTLLGAARKVGRYGAPILGVNLGGLGFLTGIPIEHLYPAIDLMVQGRLNTESRGMLETRVLRNGSEVCRFNVLNDVVINKRTLARIIDLDVFVDKKFLTTFRADGLIIATPTGSTAYNLSAGGPILHPTVESFIVTPICPFSLTNRPIILPDSAAILVRIGKEREESVIVTFDGQVGFELYPGDEVYIYKSEKRIKLLTVPGHSYFEILRTKLRWGGATYNQNENDKNGPESRP